MTNIEAEAWCFFVYPMRKPRFFALLLRWSGECRMIWKSFEWQSAAMTPTGCELAHSLGFWSLELNKIQSNPNFFWCVFAWIFWSAGFSTPTNESKQDFGYRMITSLHWLQVLCFAISHVWQYFWGAILGFFVFLDIDCFSLLKKALASLTQQNDPL